MAQTYLMRLLSELVQQALTLQHEHDLMHHAPHAHLLDIDGQIGIGGRLVRIVDAGEAPDFAPARAGVHAALVRLLRVLEAGSHVDEVEGAVQGDGVAGAGAGLLEGGDGRGDDGGAGFGQLRGHEGDPLHVRVPVRAREAQLGAQEAAADVLAQEQGDGPAALLVEGHVEGAGDGVFAAVLVARQEDGEALFEACGVRFAQHAHDFGVGEPFGDVFAAAEAGAEFCAGDVEGADGFVDFVDGFVFVGVGEVDHLLEGDHFDPELASVFLDCVLCVVRAVEVFAGTVLAWAGMVSTDDEVGGSVVLADDGMPDGFSRSAHPHRQRKQAQDGHAIWVSREESLVDADTGEVVDISWLGQTYDGMNQDVGLACSRCSYGKFSMSTVHWIPRLEGNDSGPAEF